MVHAAPGFAAAKVNLCLHVTGRQADGYHLLDSLVVFADVGDRVDATAADALSLAVGGPFGAGLAGGADNLVLRAARALAARMGRAAGARLALDKRLPVASGIGGGSADAAAALRVLAALWAAPGAVTKDLKALALGLGADVPVCMAGVPARMQGIGEVLSPVRLPRFGLVLANPGMGVATGAVFAALRAGGADFDTPIGLPEEAHAVGLAGWLGARRNALQAPAVALYPPIGGVLAALTSDADCLLARMSGSGATCFGLYADAATAVRAATALRRPGWWVWGGGVFDPAAGPER